MIEVDLNNPQDDMSVASSGQLGGRVRGARRVLVSIPHILRTSGAKLVAVRRWESILIPLATTLLSLAWLGNWSDTLFSEDGLLLVNPFGYSANPLSAYGYIYSTSFPVPDNQVYFFVDSLAAVLSSLGLGPAFTSRLLLLVVLFIASLGFVLLTRRLLSLSALRIRHETLVTLAATLFYLMNPFTLTVTWWHFSGWTFFYALLPFVLIVTIDATWAKKHDWLVFSLAVFFSILLAPGLNGGFAGSLFLILCAGILLTTARWLTAHFSLRELIQRLLLPIGYGILALSWSFVPFVATVYSNGPTTANPGGILESFDSAGVYTGAWNVLRLQGFSWVYNVPDAYAWIAYLPVLLVLSMLIPMVWSIAVLSARRRPPILLTLALGLLGVAGSLEGNPPGGTVNRWLLQQGGPFLILVNGYYFVGELWVVTISLSVLLVLGLKSPELGTRQSDQLRHSGELQNRRRRFRRWTSLFVRSKPYVVVAATLILVVGSFIPFALNEVYQPAGPNVNEIVIPPSFLQLHAYLRSNYSGPYYYALTLPLSTTGAMFLNIGTGGLADDGILLARYVPYPLIWNTSTPISSALDNAMANGSLLSLSSVLATLEIKYVIVNPYANLTNYFMSHAPNGRQVNLTEVETQLREEVGPSEPAGTFNVFTIPRATPIVRALGSLPTVIVPSAPAYVQLLGAINPGAYLDSPWLPESTWGAHPVFGESQVVPLPVAAVPQTFSVERGFEPEYLMANGTIIPSSQARYAGNLSGVTFDPQSGQVVVSGEEVFSSRNATALLTNFAPNGTGLTSTVDSSRFAVSRDVLSANSSQTTLNFTVRAWGPNNWVTLSYTHLNLTLRTFLFVNTSQGVVNLGEVAQWDGKSYAWSNTPAPWLLNDSSFSLRVSINGDSIVTGVRGESGTLLENSTLFFTPGEISQDPGSDSANAPASAKLVPFQVNLTSNGPACNITNFTVTRLPTLSAVLMTNLTEFAIPRSDGIAYGLTGDYTLSFTAMHSVMAVILGLPASPLWHVVSNGGSTQTMLVGSAVNAFAVRTQGQNSTITIHLTFDDPLDTGLAVGVAEFVGTGGLAVWLFVRRLRNS